jgi:hypothetical protein
MRLLQALAMCYCEFDCDNICECDYVVGYIYICCGCPWIGVYRYKWPYKTKSVVVRAQGITARGRECDDACERARR